MHHAGVLAFLVFPALLLLWERRDKWGRSPWPAAVVATLFGFAQVREALANIRAPREWDYGCFWLYAHVARAHENVYDPQTFAGFALPFRVDRDFIASVIRVGFPYPPPSIALFLPFGGIDDVARGLALWYVAGLLAFAVAIWVLQRAFFPADGLRAAVLIAALALTLPALATNTSQAQTNVFLFALLALAFLQRERSSGAFWSALAIWVKPYAIVLVLVDIAAGRTRRLAIALITIALSLALSAAYFGWQTFATYFLANPGLREPPSALTEADNQSLLATLLRGTHEVLGAHVVLLHEYRFLALAAGLVVVTGSLCVRYRAKRDLCFALSLVVGLILYPGTLASYGTIALLPLLVLWSRRDALPFESAGVALVAGAVVALQGPFHAGFIANVLLWCVTALTLTRAATARKPVAGTLRSV